MCGIVAVTGYRQALPLLINGLEKLEYRGYDSSGIAIVSSENNDLPVKSSLGKKMSNIAGQLNFKPKKFIDFGYDFLTDNNLDQINYHKINSTFKVNNFVTSFEFIEENNDIGDESFIANETSFKINENKMICMKNVANAYSRL